MGRAKIKLGFIVVLLALLTSACPDPPDVGELIIDVDRLALRAGVTEVDFVAQKLVLFYGSAPVITNDKHVDCSSGVAVLFSAAPIRLDLSQTGRTYLATANAPVGELHEVWLVMSNRARVTENGLVRPLHTTLKCSDSDAGVVRLTSADPKGVLVSSNALTEIAAQFDPNTDIDHKDPDNAGGKGRKMGMDPDLTGDLHGGLWSLASAIPFILVPPALGTSIIDGQIVVRFKDGTSSADIQSAISAQSMTVARKWSAKNYYVLQTQPGADERPILQYYAGLGSVLYTSPNTYVGSAANTFDPQFLSQPQWPQVGLNEVCVKGTAPSCDGKADSTSAWATTVGSFKNVIALVDGDFDPTNPDVFANFYINTDEIPKSVLAAVGDQAPKDGVVDWHDLDADGDGVLTFADLTVMNLRCNTLNGCVGLGANIVCPGGECSPRGLISGKGLPDPNRSTCGTTPTPGYGWEDGVDGDGTSGTCNGFVDDIVGWNFNCLDPSTIDKKTGRGKPFNVDGVTGCNDLRAIPQSTVGPFFLTHGTTVAAIAAAAGVNGTDGVGVAWKARILPIQFESESVAFADQSDARVSALRSSVFFSVEYARAFKPDVLNMSLNSWVFLGGTFAAGNLGTLPCRGNPVTVVPHDKSQEFNAFKNMLVSELADMQKDLQLDGSLAVVASGDCGRDHDSSDLINFPGSMTGSNVLVVASVGSAGQSNVDEMSTFSDFGSSTVDIAAPGEFFVTSTIKAVPNVPGQWQYSGAVQKCDTIPCAGTSFSAPMVAGAATLLTTVDPSLKGKPCAIADRLLRNATSLSQLSSSVRDGLRLDVQAAIQDTGTSHGRSCP